MKSEALARAEAAEARLAKAERDYEISQMWLKTIEESQKKREEAKAAEYAKAVEAAEYRRKQNEAERAERLRWENMSPEELNARKEKCRQKIEEMQRERDRKLLERLGSPEAVAEFKRNRKNNLLFLGQNVKK